MLCSCLFTFCIRKSKDFSTQNAEKSDRHVFYSNLPIAGFTSNKIPYLNTQIEGERFRAKIDLGLNQDMCLRQALVQKLNQKKFIKTIKMSGFRGNPYFLNIYQIPFVHVGGVKMESIGLVEDQDVFRQEATVGKDVEAAFSSYPGLIGWYFFKKMCLFLNLKESQVTICDSLETFLQRHSLQSFVKMPLLFDQDLVEFESEAEGKKIRCCLDTGATWNILNTVKERDEIPADDVILAQEPIIMPNFFIGAKNFGPLEFTALPLKLPIFFDVGLGMEFFMEHQVFIDFPNHQLYIAKSEGL